MIKKNLFSSNFSRNQNFVGPLLILITSFLDFQRGKNLCNVTLKWPHAGNDLIGGLLKAELVDGLRGTKIWNWEFYKCSEWIAGSPGHLYPLAQSTMSFPKDRVKNKRRNGTKVDFTRTDPIDPEHSKTYSLIFSSVQDAETFMRE